MTESTPQAVERLALDATPSEPPAEEVEEQKEAESSPAVDDADEPEQPPAKPDGVSKRIDELTRIRREAERDRDYWRELAMRQQPQQDTAPAKPEEPKPLPKLADFDFDESAYSAVLIKHATEEAARRVREEIRTERENEQKQKRVETWRSKEAEFMASTPDYKDVAYYAPLSDAMVGIIQESDIGPQMAYYLGKPENRVEAEKISRMDAIGAARALGRLEVKLEKSAAPTPAPPPKPPVSKAPTPPPRIEALESASPVRADSADSDKLSDAEWMRLRDKQLARKKG